MRALLIAAAMLTVPAAAQAQPYYDAPIADSLPPPEVVDRGAAALGRAVDGLMQVDVGPVVDAIDPYRYRSGRRETLGELARRDDPYFDERVHSSIGALADGMIMLRSRMHRLEPALRRSLDDIARSVEDATRDLHDGYYDRDRYYDGN